MPVQVYTGMPVVFTRTVESTLGAVEGQLAKVISFDLAPQGSLGDEITVAIFEENEIKIVDVYRTEFAQSKIDGRLIWKVGFPLKVVHHGACRISSIFFE